MNGAPSKSDSPSITPAVHLEFIQNQLENANTSGHEVEEYHRALFLHHHAVEWEKYREQAKVHQSDSERLGAYAVPLGQAAHLRLVECTESHLREILS